MADTPTRIFRFGAIVHPDYMELALRLPALEDRLNLAFAAEEWEEPIKGIYFAPILMPAAAGAPITYPEERHYDPETRTIWIQVRLDAEAALVLDDPPLLRWVADRLQRELTAVLPGGSAIDLLALLSDEEEE